MSPYLRSAEGDPAEPRFGTPVPITVDGEPVEALPGQTVAGALMATGRESWRTTRGYAGPRGVFCGIGACFDCLVVVNGTPDVRACQRTVEAGDWISTQDGVVLPTDQAPATGDRHVRGAPPGRRAGGRAVSGAATGVGESRPRRAGGRVVSAQATGVGESRPDGGGSAREYDVVVVGAGPAGLNAALAAAEGGASVGLVNAGRAVGGQFHRQLPEEFAAGRPGRLQHGWGKFVQLRDRVERHHRVTHLAETSVWAVERADVGHRLWVQRGPADAVGRPVEAVEARAVVLAPGAFDRVLPFKGWDLPGVYSAGAAQALAKGQRIAVGQRVVLAGTGPFLLPVAESLLGVGSEVVGMYEANALRTVARGWTSDPLVARSKLREAAGYAGMLARRGIRLQHGRAVVAAHGRRRVEAVTVAKLDAGWRPIAGSEQEIEVDAVCVGYGFTAQLELAVAARCELGVGPDGGAAVVTDARQGTSTPGVFAAGEITGIGGADLAAAEGRVAGTTAAHHATTTPTHPPNPTHPNPMNANGAHPRDTNPGPTHPGPTHPGPTHPGPTHPNPTRPGPTRPGPTHPGPTHPNPTRPGPTNPRDTNPGPTHPGSTNPNGAHSDSAGGASVGSVAGRAVGEVARGRRFARALAAAYPVRDGWEEWSDAETVVCRCEEVSRGELARVAGVRELETGRSLRLASRVGLGLCQGRVCSRNAACLTGAGPADHQRPIAVPVRLGDLADQEEL